MTEVWKDLVDYEGYYQVSNIGRIRGITRDIVNSKGRKYTIKGKIKATFPDRDGYLITRVSLKGKTRLMKVHRLVLMTFNPIENREDFLVNHKDGNKENNKISNLEWCTAGHNSRHYYNELDSGKYSRNKKLNKHQIIVVYTKYLRGVPLKELADFFNVKEHVIRQLVIGKTDRYLFAEFKPEEMATERRRRFIVNNKVGQRERNAKIYLPEVEKLWREAIPREEIAKILKISDGSVAIAWREIVASKSKEEVYTRNGQAITRGKNVKL